MVHRDVSCVFLAKLQDFFFIDPGLLHAEATGETCEQSSSDCMNAACATSAKTLLYSEVYSWLLWPVQHYKGTQRPQMPPAAAKHRYGAVGAVFHAGSFVLLAPESAEWFQEEMQRLKNTP